MSWWFWLIISIAGYVSGFLVSGLVFSKILDPATDPDDVLGAILFWPVTCPGYLLYRGATWYQSILAKNLSKRNTDKAITSLEGRVTQLQRKEWNEYQ